MAADELAAWKRLLLALFHADRFRLRKSSESGRLIDPADPLAVRLDADPETVDETVLRLAELGLVEQHENSFVLTERGFDRAQELALDRRQARRERTRVSRNEQLSRAGVYASIGILLIGLFQFLAAIYQQLGVPDVGLILAAVIGAGTVLGVIWISLTTEYQTPGHPPTESQVDNYRSESDQTQQRTLETEREIE